MQESYKKIVLRYRDGGTIFFLAVYLAASFTNLPSALVLCPLVISGLFLLLETNAVPQQVLRIRDPVAFKVIALFLFSYIASVVFSDDVLKSVNGFAVIFTGLLIAYILNQLPPDSIRYVSLSLILLVLSCSCSCILMFLQSSNSDPGFVFRDGGTPALVVPNDMLAGVIFSPIVAYTLARTTLRTDRILAALTLVALAVAIYMVDSRTCYMAAIFMIMLYLFCFHRQHFLLNSLLALLILYLIDKIFHLGLVDNLYALKNENSRLSVWLAGLVHWKDNPVLGLGPSHFEDAYQLGIRELALPDWAMIESRRVPWAHNLYIEAVIERGMLGLIALASLLVLIFIRIRTHWTSTIKPVRDFYIALLIAFGGFVFAGLFESTMQRIWVANSLFIFIGLAFSPIKERAPS